MEFFEIFEFEKIGLLPKPIVVLWVIASLNAISIDACVSNKFKFIKIEFLGNGDLWIFNFFDSEKIELYTYKIRSLVHLRTFERPNLDMESIQWPFTFIGITESKIIF